MKSAVSMIIAAGILLFMALQFGGGGMVNARKVPAAGEEEEEFGVGKLASANNCHDTAKSSSIPNVSAYNDDDDNTSSFDKHFEPRPNISAYNKQEEEDDNDKSKFGKHFEPRPNISAYHDVEEEEEEKKESFEKEFEPRPNISAYNV